MLDDNYEALLTDHTLSDVQFEIISGADEEENNTYYGCRALFAIHSEVFKRMLFGQMMEGDCNNIVRLNDISCETFEFIQRCFYGLNPVLNANNVVPILCASDKYLIKPLKNLCINFILKLANIPSTELPNISINENESGISMFLSSLNLLYYSQQIDVIHSIISSMKSHSHSHKIWNAIIYDKNWLILNHSLIKLILLHLIALNNSNFKNKNEGSHSQIPCSKLWIQCKKWCIFQANLLNNNADFELEVKNNDIDIVSSVDEDKDEEKSTVKSEDIDVIDVNKIKWFTLMKKYFKTDNVIITILYEVNPYFFMKHKAEITKILNITELNKIYEHFLYKKTKNTSNGIGIDSSECSNELKLCSDNVLYLYDDFRRITRSNYGDTEFIRCASDIGWNNSIHQFTVKCFITGNQASLGIVTNPKSFIDPQSAFPFDISEVGISYYWYGSNVYGYRFGQQQFNNNIGYEWQNGDIISIIVNCNKWTIQFLKNYEKIGKSMKIIPDQYYYVALCDGIYSEEIYYEGLIDYKVIVCQ